jgi:phosphoribosylformylglycinamidine synthase PurS subunit
LEPATPRTVVGRSERARRTAGAPPKLIESSSSWFPARRRLWLKNAPEERGRLDVYKVSVYVTPKQGVVDPQGAVIERALPALGHSGAGNIRVGRYITLEVEDGDLDTVRAQVDDMCRKLLANPIIEDYRFEVAREGEGA